ncbi:MAG: hypothetical protein HQL59_10155 [Magnetococcales bacterium]|nr:hypothetical protein [Magnetococcales bacterium]
MFIDRFFRKHPGIIAGSLIVSVVFLYVGYMYLHVFGSSCCLITRDSRLYLGLASGDKSWTEMLGTVVPLGYPIYLMAHKLIFGSYSWVAIVQLLMYEFSVLLFFIALLRAGFSAFGAVASVLPLVFTDDLFGYIAPEALSSPFVLISLSMVIFIKFDSSRFSTIVRRGMWLVLVVAVAVIYHGRPSSLPYLIIIPFFAVFLEFFSGWNLGLRIQWKPLVGVFFRYLSATFLPYLGYCVFRLIIVGHFGLVSYGGSTAIGVTAPLLKAETIPLLSAELRPLAGAMLQAKADNRAILNALPGAREFDDEEMKKYGNIMEAAYETYGMIKRHTLGRVIWEDLSPDATVFGFPIHNYYKMVAHYDDYRVLVGWKPAVVLFGGDRTEINKIFTRLASELIVLYPVEYARWVISGLAASWSRMCRRVTFDGYLMLLFLPLAMVNFIAAESGGMKPACRVLNREVGFTLVLAAAVFVPLSLLLALVTMPLDRYVDVTATFVPTFVALLMWRMVCQAWCFFRNGYDNGMISLPRSP